MSLKEFLAGDYEEGSHYELIDGRLYATPLPNLPEDLVEDWLYMQLKEYARAHPKIINRVANKARVFVPGHRRTTAPEPDVAAYHNFPSKRPYHLLRWQDVSPILVAEVLSYNDPHKDLVRNVALYSQVPTIR